VRALGRASADANLTTIYRLFYKVGSIQWVLQRGVRLWGAHYDSGNVEVMTRGPKAAVARVRDFDTPDAVNCLSVTGWCERTLGRFLHHLPAERLGSDAAANDGLRRAWFFACKEEAINPRKPTRLPLLFALDAKLGIAGGVVYSPRPRPPGAGGNSNGGAEITYGDDFADASFSGDADAMGGADAGGDGGGDGGGCGGGD